jgi:hypothetical protein
VLDACGTATLRGMFHIELRQFPHVAREFNVSAEKLERVVRPWVEGNVVEMGERKWAPERARLTIYEGPQLRPDEIGMGRGWSNATRSGQDVTDRVLEEAQGGGAARPGELADFKLRLLAACATAPIEVRESVRLAGVLAPGARASERLALAEQAVWELLHTGNLRMLHDGREVAPGDWEPLLLAWATWGETGAEQITIAVSSS